MSPIVSTLAGASARGYGGLRTFAPATLSVEYLVVAGGGGGGGTGTADNPGAGGGGAGGMRTATGFLATLSTNYTVTVGAAPICAPVYEVPWKIAVLVES